MAKVGRNERCPCGSGKKYKRCCLELREGSGDDRGHLQLLPPAGSMTLEVETSIGTLIRPIPPAMPPRLQGGKGVEDATHGAATIWGLPDLLMKPCLRKLGSGTREIGDGVLVTEDLGVVIQVKARLNPSGDQAREGRWLAKAVRKAARQGRGSVRHLASGTTAMTNARGIDVSIDGRTKRWLTAVVIDHPGDHLPPMDLAQQIADEALVVMSRRDWDFLFDQLKSASAVCRYLDRIAGKPETFGCEAVRYFRLADADARAEPAKIDPVYLIGNEPQISEPLLPMEPAATADRPAHAVFRSILEDIAITGNSTTSENRLRVLVALDHLSVGQREAAGRYLLDGLEPVSGFHRPAISWKLRRIVIGHSGTQLGFGACSYHEPLVEEAFLAWVQLRHHEFSTRTQADLPVTVGVLLTPRRDGKRPWDTTMFGVEGDLDLTHDQIESFTEVWKAEAEALDEAA